MDHVMDKIGNQVSMIHDIEENFSGIRSGLTGLEQNAAAISREDTHFKGNQHHAGR